MSGKRMLVWLAFGVFIGAIMVAALLVPPRHSGRFSTPASPLPLSPAPHS